MYVCILRNEISKLISSGAIIQSIFINYYSPVPPACLLDPSLGSHEYVMANGLKFHCVSAGDKSKPLMLFVHGFPEVPLSIFGRVGGPLYLNHLTSLFCSSGFPGATSCASSARTIVWLPWT